MESNVSIMSLWLPILLSAVGVFILSSIIHMLLPYHKSNVKQVPNEGAVMDALRPFNIPPGDYMMPRCNSSKEMSTPEFTEKLKQGPVITMTVLPSGSFSMGSSLVQWFIYSLVVGIVAAYLTGHALSPGAMSAEVIRFAGCTAFASYAIALLHDSIWYKRAWSTTFKFMFDGLLYGILTGFVFSWFWPAM